jgi:hypothetical protein
LSYIFEALFDTVCDPLEDCRCNRSSYSALIDGLYDDRSIDFLGSNLKDVIWFEEFEYFGIRRIEHEYHIMLRPQDVVVLLKLSLLGEERPPYLKIANDMHMYPSEVYTSIKRARASQLLQGPEMKDRVNRSALLEFLLHGIRYAFPAETGSLTRGIPTSYGASLLNEHIDSGSEPLPVWPYPEGHTRGYSFISAS